MKKLILFLTALLIVAGNSIQAKYWWYGFRWDNKIEIHYWYHDVALLNEGKGILFFSDPDNYKNYTYIIDLKDRNVRPVVTDSAPKVYIKFHMSHIAEGKAILFGGETFDHIKSCETWIFDSSDMKWRNMNPPNHPPFADSLNMCYLSEGKVLLMASTTIWFTGGHGRDVGKTWVYDLSKNDWEEIKSDTIPLIEYGDYFSFIDTNKVLAVRMYEWSNENHTWLFDYEKKTWTELQTKHKPLLRGSGGDMALIDSAKVMLYGGYDFTLHNGIDTIDIFDLGKKDWEVISPSPYPSISFCTFDLVSRNNIVLPRKDTIWVLTTDSLAAVVDTIPPVVVSTYPQNKQSNVPIDVSIKIEFSEEMDSSSFNIRTFRLESNDHIPVEGKIEIDKQNVYFIPKYPLSGFSLYTIYLDSFYYNQSLVAVSDKSGNKLQEPYQFYFVTRQAVSVRECDGLKADGKIFPNPGDGFISVPVEFAGNTRIEIYNVNGQKVDEKDVVADEAEKRVRYNTERLLKGSYYIKVISGDEARSYVFVKE